MTKYAETIYGSFKSLARKHLGWTVYVFLATYSVINISSIRYGSPDDLSIASIQFSEGNSLESALIAAEETGRVQQIPFFLLNRFALLEEPAFLTQSIKLISASLIFILYLLLIKSLYTTKIALVASLILLGTLSVSGEFNAINSFPLWFSLGIITFLGSCLMIVSYLKTKKSIFLPIVVILFMISLLSSEVFFLLALTFPAIHCKASNSQGKSFKIFELKIFYSFVIGVSAIYFSIYQWFKHVSGGNYEGTAFTFSNPIKSIVATFTLSLGQVNIYGLKRQFQGELFPINFFFIFVFMLFFWILLKEVKKLQSTQAKVRRVEIIVIGFLALLGNLLLGFTIKYSEIGLIYPLYLQSLISYLFLCLGLSLFLIRINTSFVTSIVLIISIFSYFSYADQSNVYSKLRANQNVFKVVDCFTKNPEILTYLQKDIVSNDIAVMSKAYGYNYFGEKMKSKTGKNYSFFRDMTVDLQQLKISEIEVTLDQKSANGVITNFDSNKAVELMTYTLLYQDCKFDLNYLTVN
jgi:hypothetical protein